jgi:hypothetical protein
MKHFLDFRGIDVKHYIDMFEERGQDLRDLRARFESLLARIPGDARGESPEWEALEREVLTHEDEQSKTEPNDYEQILAARPADHLDTIPCALAPEALRSRVAGGWYGRIAGCVLGKPVECLMKEGDRGCNSRSKMKELLQANGDYPLRDYLSEKVMLPYWHSVIEDPSWFEKDHARESLREHMRYAPRDDDIDYTIVGMRQVALLGRVFSPDQSNEAWERISPDWLARFRCCRLRHTGLQAPATATFLNATREWIGAQIRPDYFGYICPGRPADAARMAWADAAKDHTRNGIYGSMWVAACIAAAFAEGDMRNVIALGLQQVPAASRLTGHITRTVEAALRNGDDFEMTFDDITARLGAYHPIHAINNACIIAAALIHGKGDYTRTIGIAVMGGLDTDCNGASAGSILGAAIGREAIPDYWTKPFNGVVRSTVGHTADATPRADGGGHEVAIDELVDMTLATALS